MRAYRGIIICLLVALFVRIFLLTVSSTWREHPDVLRWKDWGTIAYLHGLSDTYKPDHLSFGTYPNNMPPVTLYVVSGMYYMWLQFGKVLAIVGIAPGSNAWVNVVLLRIFLQIPSILADLGIGYLIYRFAGVFAASLFLFNPVVLFNSVIWGQMDAINNFFALLGLWFITRGKVILAGVWTAVSFMTKFSLLYLAPLFFLHRKNAAKLLIVQSVVVVLLVVPVSTTPIVWFLEYISRHSTGEMTNISAFALNGWWTLFAPTVLMGPSNDITKVVDVSLKNSPLTQTMYGPVSLGVISAIVSLVFISPIYVWFHRVKKSTNNYMRAFAALAIVAFLTFPHMHERYLYPAFAPLAILVGLQSPLRWEFVLLSLLNLMNVIIVWHPMPFPSWVFDILRSHLVQWLTAFATTLVGFWTVWKLCFKK